MSTPAKSIAEAINEVTEDEILDDDTEGIEDDTEDTDDSTDEPAEEAAEEESGETHTGDVEGEEQEEEQPAADDEPDAFDSLTPEEIAAIKADPTLNKLRKSLMRGYTTKTQEHAQLVQLGQAYRQNPAGVLKAIADNLGFQILPPGQQPQVQAQQAAPPQDPGQDLENLFGPQIGPKVRAVFEKWAETRIGAAVGPVQQTVGQVVSTSEQARMFSEEQAFKARHKDVNPQIEQEIVALGNSGKIVPGDMSPAEYLDTLYDVVMARRARVAAKGATRSAATKLASKIEANRRDREPSGQSGRGGSVQKVSKISEAKSISEALDMAMAELENER